MEEREQGPTVRDLNVHLHVSFSVKFPVLGVIALLLGSLSQVTAPLVL
jgi:hypothetical protein